MKIIWCLLHSLSVVLWYNFLGQYVSRLWILNLAQNVKMIFCVTSQILYSSLQIFNCAKILNKFLHLSTWKISWNLCLFSCCCFDQYNRTLNSAIQPSKNDCQTTAKNKCQKKLQYLQSFMRQTFFRQKTKFVIS